MPQCLALQSADQDVDEQVDAYDVQEYEQSSQRILLDESDCCSC